MTFSRWCAAGNEYLLAERAELGAPLTPEGVRAEVGGSDGILEVVAVAGREAEVVIWNPDGSTAELSGNGTRIVARWLADRSGAEDVTVRVGDRTVAARLLPDGEIEQEHRDGRGLRAGASRRPPGHPGLRRQPARSGRRRPR